MLHYHSSLRISSVSLNRTNSVITNRLRSSLSSYISTGNIGITSNPIRCYPSTSSMSSGVKGKDRGISYLSAADASKIDELLVSDEYGWKIEQLMELAGLSCAQAIYEAYCINNKHYHILVVCGPGNNGGDGLVAARHLTHFGCHITVLYPKPTDKPLYQGLVKQLHQLKIHVKQSVTSYDQYDIIIDAIFGFSFKAKEGIKPPFDNIIKSMVAYKKPIISIDIPSGWDVDEGDIQRTGLQPEMLISLSAPKKCAKQFNGQWHALGGRFIPPSYILYRYRYISQLHIHNNHMLHYTTLDTDF